MSKMGEWSKSVGEKGEELVKFLFEEILGFNSLIENQSIPCINGEKHKISKKDKSTHGIDGLVYYKSPVEDELLDICLISSKYTSLEYPKNPKSKFKSHFQDLAFTIECFNNSEYKNRINQQFIDVEKTHLTGVLVWLSDKSDINFDLTSKVNNILISKDLIFDEIILIDNERMNFLFQSIYMTKQINKTSNIDFVYHNSGININSRQLKTYGKTFPINYIYSDIIPLRIEENNTVKLSIFINDDYDIDNLGKVLSFAKSFDDLNAIDETIINYRNFNSTSHINSVKEKLMLFDNYKFGHNLFINKFPIDFRK